MDILFFLYDKALYLCYKINNLIRLYYYCSLYTEKLYLILLHQVKSCLYFHFDMWCDEE